MRTNKLLANTLVAWLVAFIYEGIKTMTGYDFRPLVYVALVVMIVGLYFGLYANNEHTKETEKAH